MLSSRGDRKCCHSVEVGGVLERWRRRRRILAVRRWVILGNMQDRKRIDFVCELWRAWMAKADCSILSSLVVRNCWMKASFPIEWPRNLVPVVISASAGLIGLRKERALWRWARFAGDSMLTGLVPLVEDRIRVLLLLRWMPKGLPRVSICWRKGMRSSWRRQTDVSSMTLAVWARPPRLSSLVRCWRMRSSARVERVLLIVVVSVANTRHANNGLRGQP